MIHISYHLYGEGLEHWEIATYIKAKYPGDYRIFCEYDGETSTYDYFIYFSDKDAETAWKLKYWNEFN